MSAPEWKRDATERLIEEYRKHQVLYNMRHPRYYNKGARNEAVTRLLDVVQQYRPETTPQDVLRKIQTLRTQFGQETSKSRRLTQSGKMYQPTAWWFKGLSFLQNHIKHRSSSPVDSDSSWKQEVDNNSSINVSIVRNANNDAELSNIEYDHSMDLDYDREIHYEINAIEDIKNVKTLEVKPVIMASSSSAALQRHKMKTQSRCGSQEHYYQEPSQSPQPTEYTTAFQTSNMQEQSVAKQELISGNTVTEIVVVSERCKSLGNFIASQMACIKDDYLFYEAQMEMLNIMNRGVLRQLAIDKSNREAANGETSSNTHS
ncbi:uncharacterized protein LOC128274737 [Anopheles cruzii]|uniref:uncharacterized protein LOC128274737 n=1 Tax=Anopheles cruzii TaxID=68878 RepID=UPI0022EC55F2|nr:uncharacterized protein LOC128274737 [Anopheles cruzii]